MRIFVSGSRRKLSTEVSDTFDYAARQLGIEIARRGHNVSVLSDKEYTVDANIVAGMEEQGKRYGPKPVVEVHRTSGSDRIYKEKAFVTIDPVSYQHTDSKDFRLGPRIGAISNADVVLLMGGDSGTRIVGRLAMDLRKPVAAIESFGGAAAEVFTKLEPVYLQRLDTQGKYACLHQAWNEEQSAAQIIEFIEALGGDHSYFISYAHEDSSAADHVELLLRRANRTVYRDEHELRINDRLVETIESLISQASTFLLLWSAKSKGSKWCQRELHLARESAREIGRPYRTIMMVLDQTPMPDEFERSLQSTGTDRDGRSRAVSQILDSEKGGKTKPA
jgi:TIR domain